MTQQSFLHSIKWHKVRIKKCPVSEKNLPMSPRGNAVFENCPEIFCKSPEESRAVSKIIFPPLMYTPSGPAYKFMAELISSSGWFRQWFLSWFSPFHSQQTSAAVLLVWANYSLHIQLNHGKLKHTPLLLSEMLLISCVLNENSC